MIRRDSDRPERANDSQGASPSLADDLVQVLDALREIPRASWDMVRVALVRRRASIERWGLRLLAGFALAAVFGCVTVAAFVMALAGAAGVVASWLGASYWTGALCVGLSTLAVAGAVTWHALSRFRRHRLRALSRSLAPTPSHG